MYLQIKDVISKAHDLESGLFLVKLSSYQGFCFQI